MTTHLIHILVVDDNLEIGKAIIRTLKLVDIEAKYFQSVDEAVAEIENNLVDLLITDYLMPKMNGLELIKCLKDKHPGALGMLITGSNDFSLAVSAINNDSIIHFFTKPFKPEEMQSTVQKAIYSIQERKQYELFRQWRIDFNHKGEGDSVLESLQKNAIEGLTQLLQAKEESLYQHSTRLAQLSAQFGKYIGLSQEQIENIRVGALMHDIGKLAIKDQILDKSESLDPLEYDKMKSHPRVGAQLLEKLGVNARIVACVLQHHEYVNGNGYPNGLTGTEISIDAKIVAIADTYDALRSKRTYKEGYDFDTTRELMYGMADVIYDRTLLNQFFDMLTS